eukprot:4395229-Karenia_brevis.AAC.1
MSDGPCNLHGHTYTETADDVIGALACTHTLPLAEGFPMTQDVPDDSMQNTRRGMSGAHASEAIDAHVVVFKDPDDEQP